MNKRELLKKIISGSKNMKFADMVNLVRGFGFELSRTEGSHHIFSQPDIRELVNLQNIKGQPKLYQMRQFQNWLRNIILNSTISNARLSY